MNNHTISSFISSIFDSYKIKLTDDITTLKYDIQTIICDVLDVNKTYLYLNSDKQLANDEFEQINLRVSRLIRGEPLAYILGYKYFWDQKLLVTQDTLIPRADTEVLVESVLDNIENKSAKLKILDLGTGAGAIALALAGELPNSDVIAVDFSKKALEVARRNAKENNITNIKFMQSDWYQSLESEEFDIIVSNPPYIDFSDSDIDVEVTKYEPSTALFAKNNGLADIEIIISQAQNFLKDRGQIYIEHGYAQARAIQEIFKNHGFKYIQTVKDLNSKDRCTQALYCNRST
ncbi:SAM-dependent methyltransferase [Candidatus Francisella endociliophora]|uniref:Release factor glutamine methyltransferase n=1 Tax=Candidatus Francisella endociliophora TaxID=653937 RepID=A0A097EP92_9GAMM|nr:peptide chain release factor N(5)-glutamine methyltransferase [Francisella sp. FSC1006]AIT09379.1 SAM-dependent methyltransferase [Francisella sp. FSC1006]